ncbi:MAG: acyltransferase family protein [Roseburia intestinalis]
MVCKGAVPLFFMVSGALLLGKNESGKDLFQKRILRMILVIVIFSFLYYMKLVLKGERPFAPFSFLLSLPTDLVYLPYWFLYSYISVCLRFCRSCAHWHRICRKIPSGI